MALEEAQKIEEWAGALDHDHGLSETILGPEV